MDLCKTTCFKLCGKCDNCIQRSFYSSPFRFLSVLSDEKLKKICMNTHSIGIFKCFKCMHTWNSTFHRISISKFGCIYCNKIGRIILCGNINCEFCLKRSFCFSKYRFLSKKSDEELCKISIGSQKRDIFYCDKCLHSWNSCFNNIGNGYGCPYCKSGKLCLKFDCNNCLQRSFLSSKYRKLCLFNDKKLRIITKFCNKKGKFKCLTCENQWEAIFSDISSGHGCSLCKFKTQNMVYQFLKENNDSEIFNEKKFSWLGKMRFDIVIDKYIIEIDGLQHFLKIKHFNKKQSLQDIQRKDKEKMILAHKNGYKMIRLHQEDVYNNKIPWKEFLIEALKSKKPLQTLSCESNIYDHLYKCVENPLTLYSFFNR